MLLLGGASNVGQTAGCPQPILGDVVSSAPSSCSSQLWCALRVTGTRLKEKLGKKAPQHERALCTAAAQPAASRSISCPQNRKTVQSVA